MHVFIISCLFKIIFEQQHGKKIKSSKNARVNNEKKAGLNVDFKR